VHRRLLRADPFRVESYRELVRLFRARNEQDKAFVACEILVYLRAQKAEEDVLFHELTDKVAAQTSGQLTADEHLRFILHTDERGAARRILEIVAPELGRVFAEGLDPYQVNPRTDRHGTKSDLPIRKLADELAGAIGAPAFDIWVTRTHESGVFSANAETPALIVGAQVDRRLREREKRFLLGRELERIKGGHHVIATLPPKDLTSLVFAAARLGNPDFSAGVELGDLDLMQRRLAKVLSRKARKALEELSPRDVPLDVDRHRRAAVFTGNRAGLALTADIPAAVRAALRDKPSVKHVFTDADGARETIGQSDEVRDLLLYAVSEEYFAARKKLGFSVQ
jgi:hypothetical protein